MAGNTHVPLARVDAEVVGPDLVALIDAHLARLHGLYPHLNRTFCYDQLLVTLLIGFHQPCNRSLRLMEGLSGAEEDLLPAGASYRSTMSEALGMMDPAELHPLLKDLINLLPKRNPAAVAAFAEASGIAGLSVPGLDLDTLLQRVRLMDGSIFTVPADVAWAIAVSRSNRQPGRQIRLNLQLDLVRGVEADFSLSGDGDGSETAAFTRDLVEGAIYVCDRNFIDFKFIHALLNKTCDFVIRAKASEAALNFVVEQQQPLSKADIEANVLSDSIGYLPGSYGSPGFGQRRLRQVIVHDYRNNQTVRLITNLLDLPASVIGHLYRRRWDIELFFRWLKCVAKFEHLFSHSANGVSIQFYVAIIMTVMTCLRTGNRPGKYEFHALGWVASGTMSVEKMIDFLARRQRERDLNNARYRRKRENELAAKKQA